MNKIRAKHVILAASVPFVLYAILGGFLGRAIARDSSYRYLSVFQDVVTLVMNNYVTPPEMDRVMDGAIRGMMEALDPDSCYLTPDEYRAFRNPSDEPQADIGVELTKRYYLQVVAVLKDSPAEKAGIEPADLIKSIDGTNTREVNIISGEAKLRGAPGSDVKLEIIRGRSPDPIEMTISRREVVTAPVAFDVLEEGVGYVAITSFRDGTATDVRRAVEVLKGRGAHALILDVRNSYGRIAEDGARVAELFVNGGVAARLQSRKGETSELTLEPGQVAFDGPIAVLINRGSSGAAEIVASAFKTAERGELLGVQTSGRSAVQKALSLGDGAGIVISVAQYWTPDGKALLGEGLEPTIEVAMTGEEEDDEDPVIDRALEVLKEAQAKKAA